MTRYLLDVNLLLALSDPSHYHHELAHAWFQERGSNAWATCPLTENGFVRVASNPKYPNRPGDAPVVLALLRSRCNSANHAFWPDSVSLRTKLGTESVFTHHNVTDLYLLALAIENGGKLATLDRSIPAGILSGGPAALELIA